MLTLCYQLIWKTPTAGLFVLRAWKRPELHAHSLRRFARPNGSPVTRGSGSDVTMAGLDSTTRGGWQGSRVMQAMFVLGLEFALSKSDELAPSEITRVGLQDDMTFTGSAAALNRSWSTIERCAGRGRSQTP